MALADLCGFWKHDDTVVQFRMPYYEMPTVAEGFLVRKTAQVANLPAQPTLLDRANEPKGAGNGHSDTGTTKKTTKENNRSAEQGNGRSRTKAKGKAEEQTEENAETVGMVKEY